MCPVRDALFLPGSFAFRPRLTVRRRRRILPDMESRAAYAPAKINLTLGVGPRRPDGYHGIESLVARIELCDRLVVSERADDRITLFCDDPSVPADESNLALRAARALAGKAFDRKPGGGGRRAGASIELYKRIPAGAGLGGGSSDAATALLLLNDLWRTGLSRAELAALGASLGSDVPLFFHSSPCVLRGRGEIVEDLATRLSGWALLVTPLMHSSTPAVYRAFDEMPAAPRAHSLSAALQGLTSCEALMPLLYNDLEAPAFRVRPELKELADKLRAALGVAARMTGSGSAFYRLYDSRAAAEEGAPRVRAAGLPEAAVVGLST
jgi:4-diphosphocytidyl-2-C-methyl-D-erythritol kinase